AEHGEDKKGGGGCLQPPFYAGDGVNRVSIVSILPSDAASDCVGGHDRRPWRGQSLDTLMSSSARRSGFIRRLISTIFPDSTRKTNAARGCPPTAQPAPASPSIRACRAPRARPLNVSATDLAPWISLERLGAPPQRLAAAA